jgi:hypothetical protein
VFALFDVVTFVVRFAPLNVMLVPLIANRRFAAILEPVVSYVFTITLLAILLPV